MKTAFVLLAVISLCPSCISVSAYQRDVRNARLEELDRAEKWARDVKSGALDPKDMLDLIEYRHLKVAP